MRHGADQSSGSAGRYVAVRVQRNDVAYTIEVNTVGAVLQVIACVGGAAQKFVEFFQLATLSFPSHPTLRILIPQSAAMKQQKRVNTACRVSTIEIVNAGHGLLQ